VGPLQLSFAPLAQTSSYATDCWVHRVRALEHKVRVLEMEQSCRLYCSSLIWWLILVTSFRLLKKSNHHRVFLGRGKIVIHWPVRGCKKVGDHCLRVYLPKIYF